MLNLVMDNGLAQVLILGVKRNLLASESVILASILHMSF